MFLLPENAWEMRTRTYDDNDKKKNNRGIFALKDIEAGTVIGDYIGLIIPEEKEDDYEKTDETYLMYYDDGVTVYPDVKSAGVHVLNHSCEPNSEMYTYKGHTLYFALRKIFKGEEMTIHYHLNPIDDDCAPCTHACLCKTPSCTGSWHMATDAYEAWRAFDDKEAEKTKAVKAKVGSVLPLLDKYPESIADNLMYKLYGSREKTPEKIASATFPTLKQIREQMRKTGKRLFYPKLGITIEGTEGKTVYVKGS